MSESDRDFPPYLYGHDPERVIGRLKSIVDHEDGSYTAIYEGVKFEDLPTDLPDPDEDEDDE